MSVALRTNNDRHVLWKYVCGGENVVLAAPLQSAERGREVDREKEEGDVY